MLIIDTDNIHRYVPALHYELQTFTERRETCWSYAPHRQLSIHLSIYLSIYVSTYLPMYLQAGHRGHGRHAPRPQPRPRPPALADGPAARQNVPGWGEDNI